MTSDKPPDSGVATPPQPAGAGAPADSPVHRADGPVAAALVSAGVGAFALGVCVVLAEASPTVKEAFTWSAGVGSLSGKTSLAAIAYVLSWALLHLRLRRYNCNFRRVAVITLALVGLGQLLTFPPFFGLFSETLP